MGITPSDNAVYAALSEVIYTRDLFDQAIDTNDIGLERIQDRNIVNSILTDIPRLTLGQEIDRLN